MNASDIEIALRLTMGLLAGAILGLDRNLRGKDAGMRTLGLVALGAAAATAMVTVTGHTPDAFSRVMQGVLTGVGFLGVGVIARQADRDHVQGLTTAAAVWVAAVLGAAAGAGFYAVLVAMLVLALLLLIIGGPLERLLRKELREYEGRVAKDGRDGGPSP